MSVSEVNANVDMSVSVSSSVNKYITAVLLLLVHVNRPIFPELLQVGRVPQRYSKKTFVNC